MSKTYGMEEKDRDDVMDRLLEIGGDKKFLTFDDLNRELPNDMVSPDDIEDVLQKLEGSNIAVADEERLIEHSSGGGVERGDPDDETDEETDLDLSAGTLDKTNDPVRLYLREMGVVPLLTREGEVSIAKRIERGQIKTQKIIARSPIVVQALVDMGHKLRDGQLNIREIVGFAEQAELTEGSDDKAAEYLQWTIEGISNIDRLFRNGFTEYEQMREALKLARNKHTKPVLQCRRAFARTRLEIRQEIKGLNITERARQRLIDSLRRAQRDVRIAEREIEHCTSTLR